MSGYGVAENGQLSSEKSAGKYLMCVGGYPVAKLPSFAAAAEAARARMSNCFGSDDDISIYEIETGVHFDVPCGSRFDDSFPPAAFELLFNCGRHTG